MNFSLEKGHFKITSTGSVQKLPKVIRSWVSPAIFHHFCHLPHFPRLPQHFPRPPLPFPGPISADFRRFPTISAVFHRFLSFSVIFHRLPSSSALPQASPALPQASPALLRTDFRRFPSISAVFRRFPSFSVVFRRFPYSLARINDVKTMNFPIFTSLFTSSIARLPIIGI